MKPTAYDILREHFSEEFFLSGEQGIDSLRKAASLLEGDYWETPTGERIRIFGEVNEGDKPFIAKSQDRPDAPVIKLGIGDLSFYEQR